MEHARKLECTRRSAGSYQEAMALCPGARRFELEYPLILSDIRNGEVLVDFPSGGAYLTPYLDALAPEARYVAVEHVPGYENDAVDMTAGTWDRLNFEPGSVDVVLCLAALHHVYPGREAFYRECRRILRPGGRLIIGDVAEGTGVDGWLSEFVDHFSPEGHDARFFREDLDIPEIESSGLRVSSWELKEFYWNYPDRQTMIEFCRGLFRLPSATDADILQGLNDYLGVEETSQGVRMGWQLAFIRADLEAA